MERRLFFTSPVDHHNLRDWGSLARSLKAAVEAACGRDVSVVIGSQPVFGHGTDVDETLAELEEQRLGLREVRVDLWCSIVVYATLCVALGPGIRRQERRALLRRLLKKELTRQVLLREHEGSYDFLGGGYVYGYSISPGDDRDRSTLSFLLEPFDGPLYLGEPWLLQGTDERVDEEAFEVIVRPAPNLAIFLANDPEAEERIWEMATSGQGLIAFYPDDPAEAALVRSFADFRDLPILVAEAPSSGIRVTIGRCHQDDSLVVIYGPPGAPEIDEPVLFMI
jgi:hypothetical protein